MLVRVRCKLGNFRYTCQDSDSIQSLVDKLLQDAPDADKSTLTFSSAPKGGEKLIANEQGSIKQNGIQHGDLIFADWKDRQQTEPNAAAGSSSSGTQTNGTDVASSIPSTSKDSIAMLNKDAWRSVKEDPVDEYLEKQPGRILRKKDPKMCRHGDKAMCDYCMSLEPYDEKYQAEQKIKHLSYHAYLRKLDTAANTAASAGSSYLPPLEELNYNVAVPCTSGVHPSWPAGICSKCQPSAITLQLQPYRMVDHVEYSTPAIIENFIDFWRKTGGTQRFGYLIGHYEAYDQVPLGLKAVVEAIHEPPQAGDVDGVEVNMEWQEIAQVESLAAKCGLRIVGMIYTDLVNDVDSKTGGVICKRHSDSFFLSSLETIFAARLQKARHNPSRFSKSGKFSSKFVTCVITGNEKGEIEVKAYQASDQAMALVDADLVEASVSPGVVRVKAENDGLENGESNSKASKRYVPDVFFRYKNEYNIMVKESAKPCFPVDYLLVSLTHGFPEQSRPLFVSNKFTTENRIGFQDQSQDAVLQQVNALLPKLPANISDISGSSSSSKGKGRASDTDSLRGVANWLSDWHLLSFMQMEMVGKLVEQADLDAFVQAAIQASKDEERWMPAVHAVLSSAGWQTLAAFASAHSATSSAPKAPKASSLNDGFEEIPPELLRDTEMDLGPSSTNAASSASGVVVCPHCTFENEAGTSDCAICGLPLAG